jgi:hypothetical protein
MAEFLAVGQVRQRCFNLSRKDTKKDTQKMNQNKQGNSTLALNVIFVSSKYFSTVNIFEQERVWGKSTEYVDF